jgi:Dolichyl-phosphate-mannose-protein mannosyltransferase
MTLDTSAGCFVSYNRRVQKRRWIIVLFLFAAALVSRLCVSTFLASDEPGDSRVYSQLARNVLEGHGYSDQAGPPYDPTLIRVPGYPLFLASVYAVFGHGDDRAVRIVQALLDTASCLLVAALAFFWQPSESRRWRAFAFALALAAVCPFGQIYAATILTETLATFLALALALAATLALKSRGARARLLCWALAGLCAGSVALVRPDGGLFAAGVGVTLVLALLFARRDYVERAKTVVEATGATNEAGGFARRIARAFACGCVFSAATVLVLVPWALRNERVFHLFQPLAPYYATMPDEFNPRGYFRWVRTWIDDERYIDRMLWKLGRQPIRIEQVPDRAFDSPEEKTRVAALLDLYDQKPEKQAAEQSAQESKDKADDESADDNKDNADDDNESADDKKEDTDKQSADDDKSGEGDDESSGSEDSGDEQGDDEAQEGDAHVKMTPEIDAAFAQIAEERVRRAPLRYYLWLPLKRAGALWFDTHSDYFPFEGELFPLDDLDYDSHQQFWLPLFSALTWVYTLLGACGAWVLWRRRRAGAWRWLVLALLLTVPRLAFMSSLENPEPRYVVELFPFLAALGGVALASLRRRASLNQAPDVKPDAASNSA